jgi:NAD(P)-dependent dehydrogenase (short-subunit alcohol dehydrogenase family)
MKAKPLLISTGKLIRNSLAGQVAIVSGGGKGIGFEAARALAWLGCIVFIAEIDKIAGRAAALKINEEMLNENTNFFFEDVGDEGGIEHLKYEILRRFGRIDIVLNNATVAPMGAVKDKPISDWDRSYRVNLRGPVLLARACIPDMLNRNHGVFVCVSSFGGAYMAAYECFKRAQSVLADILAEELVGTGVIAFTINPGQSPTTTLEESIEVLAPLYGKTPQEFLDMNKEANISVEAAGAGFAAAIALADQFRGQETSSIQALQSAGINIHENSNIENPPSISDEGMDRALILCREVRKTLEEQSGGWKKRPLFERRWVMNDFTRTTRMTMLRSLEQLNKLEKALEARDQKKLHSSRNTLKKICFYWQHQADLAKGYTKNPDELRKQLEILGKWQATAEELANILS